MTWCQVERIRIASSKNWNNFLRNPNGYKIQLHQPGRYNNNCSRIQQRYIDVSALRHTISMKFSWVLCTKKKIVYFRGRKKVRERGKKSFKRKTIQLKLDSMQNPRECYSYIKYDRNILSRCIAIKTICRCILLMILFTEGQRFSMFRWWY